MHLYSCQNLGIQDCWNNIQTLEVNLKAPLVIEAGIYYHVACNIKNNGSQAFFSSKRTEAKIQKKMDVDCNPYTIQHIATFTVVFSQHQQK